jgi:hypothetical protein
VYTPAVEAGSSGHVRLDWDNVLQPELPPPHPARAWGTGPDRRRRLRPRPS